jgi:predicted methyltransferase
MSVLSFYQVNPAVAAFESGSTQIDSSVDLNRTRVRIGFDDRGITLPDGEILSWDEAREIGSTQNACFYVERGEIRKIQIYSEEWNRFYSLCPTERAPTMLLSGIPMHRIKGIDPIGDTERKMRTIAPVTGEVLDICTGLGYTAIAAARAASRITTIELDPIVLELCRFNPWSTELFDNPRIVQMVGDAAEAIATLADGTYSRVFHDPPTFKLAGQLYSGEFYGQLYRVTKRGGRLYHYIGDLDSTTGRVVTKGVVKRLQEAGFTRIERRGEAFGVTATRG